MGRISLFFTVFHNAFDLRGCGYSTEPGRQAHTGSGGLRYAAKILYEIMLFRVSMLDETGLYAPSMAHIILAPPSLAGHFCVS